MFGLLHRFAGDDAGDGNQWVSYCQYTFCSGHHFQSKLSAQMHKYPLDIPNTSEEIHDQIQPKYIVLLSRKKSELCIECHYEIGVNTTEVVVRVKQLIPCYLFQCTHLLIFDMQVRNITNLKIDTVTQLSSRIRAETKICVNPRVTALHNEYRKKTARKISAEILHGWST